ncbi:MAG: DUF3276 family protein [Bacteroidales bacterium]|nr:DUF3276 family protein [Bacteroidales bacterium]
MEEFYKQARNEELFSKSVRAGKRTYFFDVKSTRGEDQYLTITESKRRFDNEQGKFYYEKHKIFLYREDFDKFLEAINESIEFIESGSAPTVFEKDEEQSDNGNFGFDDLDNG